MRRSGASRAEALTLYVEPQATKKKSYVEVDTVVVVECLRRSILCVIMKTS